MTKSSFPQLGGVLLLSFFLSSCCTTKMKGLKKTYSYNSTTTVKYIVRSHFQKQSVPFYNAGRKRAFFSGIPITVLDLLRQTRSTCIRQRGKARESRFIVVASVLLEVRTSVHLRISPQSYSTTRPTHISTPVPLCTLQPMFLSIILQGNSAEIPRNLAVTALASRSYPRLNQHDDDRDNKGGWRGGWLVSRGQLAATIEHSNGRRCHMAI